MEVEGMSLSCEHLRRSPSSHYPMPSPDVTNYLQAHWAGGTRETSGSFITFLTKEALLSPWTWLPIGTLGGKSLRQLGKDTRQMQSSIPTTSCHSEQQCPARALDISSTRQKLPIFAVLLRRGYGNKGDFCQQGTILTAGPG